MKIPQSIDEGNLFFLVCCLYVFLHYGGDKQH